MATFNDIRARFEMALNKTIQSSLPELNEADNRGYEFENKIIDEINDLNNEDIRVDGEAAGNNNSVSDLGILVKGKPIAAEVKLAATDNLGALPKADVDMIKFDGKKVNYKIQRSSLYYEIIDQALSALNGSKALPVLKNLYNAMAPYLNGPLDLTKTVGSLRGDQNSVNIFKAVTDNKKLFTSTGDVIIKPETIRRLVAKKKGPNGAKTDYIIVGNNNHMKVEGQVYHLGNNPLGLDVPEFNPTGAYVEMRLQGSGSRSKGTASFSFGMKTKNSGKLNKGRTFKDANELANIFLGK